MALTKKQIAEFRAELETSFNPLFFFDDDPDGLASFLLMYRFVREGHGIVVKATPDLKESFARKVDEYMPDKVFILDKPDVTQDFIDAVNVKILWLDHHFPVKRNGIHYFNPRLEKESDGRPTAMWAHKIVQQDEWIAMVGMVGDWFLPKSRAEFNKKYEKLLPRNIKRPEDALYTTKIGELARVFSFIMKGKTSDAMQAIKVLTRIKEPEEILEQTTSQGKFIYKRYKKIKNAYDELFEDAVKLGKKKGKMLVYMYEENKMSFTGDLSNELLFRFPKKVVIIGREKNGEMKCSLRSSNNILKPLKKALEGIDGYGGGHENACGCCVNKRDWDRFLDRFEKLI